MSWMRRCECGEGGIICLFIFVTDLPNGKCYLAPPGSHDPDAEFLHETVLQDLWDIVGEEGYG